MSALRMKASTASGRATAPARPARVAVMVPRAQAAQASTSDGVSRRSTLASIVGSAALLSAAPAFAAYGDSANVFGKATNTTGFIQYVGEGFSVLVPSKWNPSKEREFKNMLLRYDDNADFINYFCVIAEPTTKMTMSDFGTPEQVLGQLGYLFGQQSFSGESKSEGGFAPGRYAAASILGIDTATDKKGREVFLFNVLTRTADGDEGGKHQLIKATVSNGNLWLVKVQVGDKRWFKGAQRFAEGIVDSFTVA
ncbi:hypothetical protein FOA52_014675 [Chlamydomonas sp. UWO 241]|nr:hypothetical protein FOA52_014675 [Chlamydomonas sp. UWO 241]